MPIIIKIRPKGAPPPVKASTEPPWPLKPVPEAPKPPEALSPLRPSRVIPCCRYCGHQYLDGGCTFEQQKTCLNHAPGETRRVIATKSLD